MSAIISADGRYRYRLTREFPIGVETVTFVMLNPWTADADRDDATIRRCKGFAQRWGFGRLIVVNLFALRSTDPAALRAHPCPEGPENSQHVLDAVSDSAEVIAARGAPLVDTKLGAADVQYACWTTGRPLLCIGKTKAGSPRHPLYVATETPRQVWP